MVMLSFILLIIAILISYSGTTVIGPPSNLGNLFRSNESTYIPVHTFEVEAFFQFE
jgi:hypothetical protein